MLKLLKVNDYDSFLDGNARRLEKSPSLDAENSELDPKLQEWILVD